MTPGQLYDNKDVCRTTFEQLRPFRNSRTTFNLKTIDNSRTPSKQLQDNLRNDQTTLKQLKDNWDKSRISLGYL